MKTWMLAALGSLALCSSSPTDFYTYIDYIPGGLGAGQCEPGISPLGQVGTDCHAWEGKRYTSLDQRIEVIEHKSYSDLRKSYEALTGKKIGANYILFGYSSEYTNDTCEIHIVDPDVDYRPEVLGHEMFHCLHGDFHPNNPVGMVT